MTLHEAGIDGVKVDAQAAITMLGVGYGGSAQMTRAYVHAMEQSAKEHLDSNVINCMCHPTENLYSFRETCVARASDDFYPREPASHTVHILNVAYNSLFLGEIVFPDWDMFQSEHPAAGLHAAARSVGGCAVYTSDRPETHDFKLLRKLVLPDGGVFRAKLPGRPTRDVLFADVATDGQSALKVWNMNSVNGVLGLFNLQGFSWDRKLRQFKEPDKAIPDVVAEARPSDIEHMSSPVNRYALWSNMNGRLFVLGVDEKVSFALKPQDYDVLTCAPCQVIPGVKDEAGREALWAPVGLTDMFNGGGAVVESTISDRNFAIIDGLLGGVGGVPPEARKPLTDAMESLRGSDPDCLVSVDDNCIVPLPTDEEGPSRATAIVRVRGEGKFLCYATVPPSKLTMREDSGSSSSSPQDAGVNMPFEWREGGELWVNLPPMKCDLEDKSGNQGKWMLRFEWGVTRAEVDEGSEHKGNETVDLGSWTQKSQ